MAAPRRVVELEIEPEKNCSDIIEQHSAEDCGTYAIINLAL
jgi:hypothetical protein